MRDEFDADSWRSEWNEEEKIETHIILPPSWGSWFRIPQSVVFFSSIVFNEDARTVRYICNSTKIIKRHWLFKMRFDKSMYTWCTLCDWNIFSGDFSFRTVPNALCVYPLNHRRYAFLFVCLHCVCFDYFHCELVRWVHAKDHGWIACFFLCVFGLKGLFGHKKVKHKLK